MSGIVQAGLDLKKKQKKNIKSLSSVIMHLYKCINVHKLSLKKIVQFKETFQLFSPEFLYAPHPYLQLPGENSSLPERAGERR